MRVLAQICLHYYHLLSVLLFHCPGLYISVGKQLDPALFCGNCLQASCRRRSLPAQRHLTYNWSRVTSTGTPRFSCHSYLCLRFAATSNCPIRFVPILQFDRGTSRCQNYRICSYFDQMCSLNYFGCLRRSSIKNSTYFARFQSTPCPHALALSIGVASFGHEEALFWPTTEGPSFRAPS